MTIDTSLLPAYTNSAVLFADKANNQDVMKNIISAYPLAVEQVAGAFSKQFRNPYEIWRFCRSHFRYLRDDDQRQEIKLPSASVRVRLNDCKSYSLFIAAVARALGYKVAFRFGGNTKGKYSHIWTMINGVPVDGCARKFGWQKDYKYIRTIDL